MDSVILSNALPIQPAEIPLPNSRSLAAIIEGCKDRIINAKHLKPEEQTEALNLLKALNKNGFVEVQDSDAERKKAVAGVQWAMEETFDGKEYIITPERPTPFRTHGEEDRLPGQAEREKALTDRVSRGNPLYLVFCSDGIGTEEQDAAYRRDILEPLASTGNLKEYLLGCLKNEFPSKLSGAQIVSYDEQHAFAIRAAQINKIDNTKVITLYFGNLNDPRENRIGKPFAEWTHFLNEQGIHVS